MSGRDGTLTLRISPSAGRIARARTAKYGVSPAEFLSWVKDFEFEVSEDPEQVLKYVRAGGESFHECSMVRQVGDLRLRIVWEVEWDESNSVLHLLDLRVFPVPPRIARNVEPDPADDET